MCPALLAAQSNAPLAQRKDLTRLDALLAAGDSAGAEALLASLGPELAKSDRLAFDTIYVLVGRGRIPEAKAQWNGLAPRLQESLRAAPPAGETASATKAREQRLAEALFTQGLLTARGGDKKEALQFLQQADGLGFPPLDSPLMLLAAECLLDLQEYDLSASAYREFLKHAPTNATARVALGASLYSAGKLTAARTELEEVLRVSPKTPRANYTLASVLLQLKEYEGARVRLERELALDPQCAPCLSRLAHVAYFEGDDKACDSWLAKAIAPRSRRCRDAVGVGDACPATGTARSRHRQLVSRRGAVTRLRHGPLPARDGVPPGGQRRQGQRALRRLPALAEGTEGAGDRGQGRAVGRHALGGRGFSPGGTAVGDPARRP